MRLVLRYAPGITLAATEPLLVNSPGSASSSYSDSSSLVEFFDSSSIAFISNVLLINLHLKP